MAGIPNMYATDDRGIYRLLGVPPGRYILSVGTNTSGTTTRMGNSGNKFYPLTFHAGVTDEAKATVVEVVGGSEATGVYVYKFRFAPPKEGTGRRPSGLAGLQLSRVSSNARCKAAL